MSKKFIVFTATEDGDYGMYFMTTKQIKEDYLKTDHRVFKELPDIGYCGAGILIIDGKIVTPKTKEVVKDWEI